jgi:ferric-dicitrate binding protein FerR (iron transport regulator)
MSKAECTVFEIELSLDDDLQSIYEKYKMIWNSYPVAKINAQPTSFQSVQKKFLNKQIYKNNKVAFKKPVLYGLVAVVVFFIGFFFYQPVPLLYTQQRVAEKGQRLSFKLPDNSTVILNSGSRVKYTTDFKNHRDIWLFGEAFFKVTKNVSSPFTVHTESLNVQVLGTEFSINSETVNKTISLKKGSVKVSLQESKDEIYLKPNEELVFNSNTNTIVKRHFDVEKTMAWKDNILVLDGEKFEGVKEKIERFYGVNFMLGDKDIADLRIRGVFKDQNIAEFISSVEFITNCRIVQIKPSNYLISTSNDK